MTIIDHPARAAAPDFASLGLPEPILATLRRLGLREPFAIQAEVIPDVLAGRDVCGRAPTGSGKTLAFGLPMVATMDAARPKRPTALVLAPTRELAEQIATALRPFVKAMGHEVASLYGGVGYGAQRKLLDRGAELVVACPGRLEDLLSMGALRLDDVTTVVVDEADQMSDMGFLPAVRRVVGQTRADRQVLLFSATLEGPVAALVAEFQREPVRHEVGERGPDITAARHVCWEVGRDERTETTGDIVRTLGSTIVFCRTRHGAERLATRLSKDGVTTEAIHGGRSQAQRDRALAAFKRGEVSALVATDVAARGVHVDGVRGVLHYDLPADGATYLHRSGRTARAGATGVVVTLVERGGQRAARKLLGEVGLDVRVTAADVATLAPVTDDAPAAARPEPSTDHSTGVVKFFNRSRGFGFVTQPDGAELFVHWTNVVGEPGQKVLDEGQRVRYEVRPGRRGLEAFDVTVV